MSSFSETIITHIRVGGFRSLENVKLDLEPVTVLVGPNSSGKSSLLDALSFLQESLVSSPEEAFKARGGVENVRTQTGMQPNALAIEIQFRSRVRVPNKDIYQYKGFYYVLFHLTVRHNFSIARETCQIDHLESDQINYKTYRYSVGQGNWIESVEDVKPILAPNRLALPLLSGIQAFSPVYRALSSFQFYVFSPQSMRSLREQDDGTQLEIDGSNASSVLKRLEENDETLYQTILQALSQLIPSIEKVRAKRRRGRQITIAFEEVFPGQKPVEFEAVSMSDGTLRILAMLLAIYQPDPPTIISLEEPETAIHPGAAAILVDALKEAALRSQILITTHSPDLLTRFDIESIRAVERVDGVTQINVITEAQREAVQERLFTLGEIHRIEGLQPEKITTEGDGENA